MSDKKPITEKPFRIVAEISKTWPESADSVKRPLVSQQFEHVLKENFRRGYDLESWQVMSVGTADSCMTETIIAVFRLMV